MNINKYKFLMIRHGESLWNNQDKFTGWTNIPLSENGKKEAVKIANRLIKLKLYPNIIFSSVLERSINTSNLIKINLETQKQIQLQTNGDRKRHFIL